MVPLQKTLNIGIGAVGIILIGYGCLGLIPDGKVFLGMSFVMRIFEACGNSMFLTGSFSAIAREFPDKVASMFAMIELFFGVGENVSQSLSSTQPAFLFQERLLVQLLAELFMKLEDLPSHLQ